MKKTDKSERNKARSTRHLSLHTAGSVSQHILTEPARLAPLPQPGWTQDLLSGWVPAVRHNPGFTEVEKPLFHVLESSFAKLAAGVGIRDAGEGYQQVTIATVSLASPSPKPASPHQLVCSRGNCDCFVADTSRRLVPVREQKGRPITLYLHTGLRKAFSHPLSQLTPTITKGAEGQGGQMRR